MHHSSAFLRPRTRGLRRGVSLIEVMTTTMLLGVTVIMALAMFPFSRFLQDRSNGLSTASAIVDKKLEQIRSLDAQNITPTRLQGAGFVDPAAGGTQLSFTTVDGLAGKLRNAQGAVTLTGVGSDLVRIDVTVSWNGMRGNSTQVTGTTYVADKTIWREP